jgi:hypothetical protein
MVPYMGAAYTGWQGRSLARAWFLDSREAVPRAEAGSDPDTSHQGITHCLRQLLERITEEAPQRHRVFQPVRLQLLPDLGTSLPR